MCFSPCFIRWRPRCFLRPDWYADPRTTVILSEVTDIDSDQKRVFVSDADREEVPIAYDCLILAIGVSHDYFGHKEFEKFARGLR
jgi:NADH:ubiquinone reductase (H+-translocating)